MFRNPIELEVLANARREELLPHRTVSASSTNASRLNGPFARTRRAMGYGLIALGERLTDRTPQPASPSTYTLYPADGRAR